MTKRKPIVIDETEEKANGYVSLVLLIMAFALAGVCILTELDFFLLDKPMMRIGTLISLVFTMLPIIVVNNRKLKHNAITKRVVIFCSVMASLTIATMLSYVAIILLALPILLSTQYHSKNASRMAYIGTLLAAVVSPVLGVRLGIWQNEFNFFLNFIGRAATTIDVTKALMFVVVPSVFGLSVYYIIVGSITANGIELNHLRKDLQQEVDKQTRNLLEHQKNLQQVTVEVVSALVETSEAKDTYTAGHGKRVASLSSRIAKELGWYVEDIDTLFICAILHDIGKIAVPDEILKSKNRLTPEEYEMVKRHSTRGYEILSEVSSLKQASTVALNHHERWDGKGYPNGLKGEEIDELSRIVAVADAFDAMTSSRAYRKNLPTEVVIEELEKGKGTQFDPLIAETMLKLIREGEIDVA